MMMGRRRRRRRRKRRRRSHGCDHTRTHSSHTATEAEFLNSPNFSSKTRCHQPVKPPLASSIESQQR